MAKAVCENGRFFFEYPEGRPRMELKLSINAGHGENLIELVVADENGVNRATPIRFKGQDGGQRVAADFPSCNAAYIITDENGHITNG
jgi:hypothetical protein